MLDDPHGRAIPGNQLGSGRQPGDESIRSNGYFVRDAEPLSVDTVRQSLTGRLAQSAVPNGRQCRERDARADDPNADASRIPPQPSRPESDRSCARHAISASSTPASMSSTPVGPWTTTALLWQNSLSCTSTPSATRLSTAHTVCLPVHRPTMISRILHLAAEDRVIGAEEAQQRILQVGDAVSDRRGIPTEPGARRTRLRPRA